MRLRALLWVMIAATAGLAGCASQVRGQTRRIEGWVTARPVEVGMNAALLSAALARLDSGRHGIDSMLVVRRGRLVVERYWHGYDMTDLRALGSATMGVTSLLVGVAVDRGLVRDVDEAAGRYLGGAYPGRAAGQGPTLADLLTMRSGRACDDEDRGSPGHVDRMHRARDWTRFFLELPQVEHDARYGLRCAGAAVTLGRVVAEASGRTLAAFAAEELFAPIGIQAFAWRSFDGGRQMDTSRGLRLRPRAMAKIGQLVLQRGVWDEGDVLSGGWVDAATTEHTRFAGDPRGYGYLWWGAQVEVGARRVALSYAEGEGGQYIVVAPALDLVVVFTGREAPASQSRPLAIVRDDIVPAAIAAGA